MSAPYAEQTTEMNGENEQQYFEQLGRRSQIRRLRQLADSALADYPTLAEPKRLTLLAHMFNTTFRVDTADGRRYVLRIHRAGTPTLESVSAELNWLAALRHDTNLQVPDPVATRDGSLLTVASASGVPTQHICVLFRWIYGQRLIRGLTPSHMRLAGELMARLHDHAAKFRLPPGFTRSRVDRLLLTESLSSAQDPFAPPVIAACQALVDSTLSQEEATLIMSTIERVREAEQELSQHPSSFGLIHADLHHYNLLFAQGTVRAIDFDDCGFGPLLYDLAVPPYVLQYHKNYPALRNALLEGYSRVRPLPIAYDRYLDTFMALRCIQDGLWVLQTRYHPAIGPDWLAEARRAFEPLFDS